MQHVFLSYRHESEEHAQAAHRLGVELRNAGVPVELDQFYLSDHRGGPDEGWPKWCEDRADKSVCVLVIASAGWFAVYEGTGHPGEGCGAAAEARIFRQAIYDQSGVNPRVRIAILDDFDPQLIPTGLRAWHRFHPFVRASDFEQMAAWIRERLAAPEKSPAAPATPRAPLPPANLHYLCDRSEQEGALDIFFSKTAPETFRRPILLIVHGDSREAHTAFVERMCSHYLPARLKERGLSGAIQIARPPTRLTAGDDADLALEVRQKIAAELQIDTPCTDDRQLLECFRKTRAPLIAPVFDFSSREAFAGERCYVGMLVEFWAQFPDLPPGLAVLGFICVKYVEPEPAGLWSRVFAIGKADGPEKLREFIDQLAIERPAACGVRVIHKVLPELKPALPEDVERWFQSRPVAHCVPRRLQYDAIRQQIFKNQPHLPMEHLLDELEKYVHTHHD